MKQHVQTFIRSQTYAAQQRCPRHDGLSNQAFTTHQRGGSTGLFRFSKSPTNMLRVLAWWGDSNTPKRRKHTWKNVWDCACLLLLVGGWALVSQARGHLVLMASPQWAKDHFPGANGPILPEASFQSVMETGTKLETYLARKAASTCKICNPQNLRYKFTQIPMSINFRQASEWTDPPSDSRSSSVKIAWDEPYGIHGEPCRSVSARALQTQNHGLL